MSSPRTSSSMGRSRSRRCINQNTEISQQITLWNQMGSRVIRGNLLVVPIGNSILYVIAALSARAVGPVARAEARDRHLWRPCGDGGNAAGGAGRALQGNRASRPPCRRRRPSPAGPADARAREALAHYDRAIERLKAGDWTGFGAELDALRPLLEELSRQRAAHQLTVIATRRERKGEGKDEPSNVIIQVR